jgi:23S rRNA (cytidine1920-2'-O)/16S rRNA (cytidine1409-2'-O)-methyltransferase
MVNKRPVTKSGFLVRTSDIIELTTQERYVSRAALKLASVTDNLKINFQDKVVLALQHGAKKVIAIEVGTQQLHHSLRGHPLIELHEQTDIRHLKTLSEVPGIVVIDVSFISLRDILPHLSTLIGQRSMVIAMVKPQFEAQQSSLKHKGVIKNDTMRRHILKDFESWVQQAWIVEGKADSMVKGAKGNQERFYILKKL